MAAPQEAGTHLGLIASIALKSPPYTAQTRAATATPGDGDRSTLPRAWQSGEASGLEFWLQTDAVFELVDGFAGVA